MLSKTAAIATLVALMLVLAAALAQAGPVGDTCVEILGMKAC